MRITAFVLAWALSACGNAAAPPMPAENPDQVVVGPNMSVSVWRSASPAAQAAYFRGAVSVHIAEPAQNETQRRFDDDLALDLRDCVTAEIEN